LLNQEILTEIKMLDVVSRLECLDSSFGVCFGETVDLDQNCSAVLSTRKGQKCKRRGALWVPDCSYGDMVWSLQIDFEEAFADTWETVLAKDSGDPKRK